MKEEEEWKIESIREKRKALTDFNSLAKHETFDIHTIHIERQTTNCTKRIKLNEMKHENENYKRKL